MAAIDRTGVFTIVRDQLSEILEIDPGAITEGQSFVDDLDADSLALIELVEALEEELADVVPNFRIDDEDLQDLKTVRDAVDYVASPRDADVVVTGFGVDLRRSRPRSCRRSRRAPHSRCWLSRRSRSGTRCGASP